MDKKSKGTAKQTDTKKTQSSKWTTGKGVPVDSKKIQWDKKC